MSRLRSTIARLKLKGFGGDSHKWWGMWVNAMTHAKSYQLLYALYAIRFCAEKGTGLHGCRKSVLQSVRATPGYGQNPFHVLPNKAHTELVAKRYGMWDDAKSIWPLWAGLHTCHKQRDKINGAYHR